MSAEHEPGIDVFFGDSVLSRFRQKPASEVISDIRGAFACTSTPRPRLSSDEKRSLFASLYGASEQKIMEMMQRSTDAC